LQRGRSVDDYTEEFYERVLRNELNESEEQKVARYIGGLHISLQDVLNQQIFGTFHKHISVLKLQKFSKEGA